MATRVLGPKGSKKRRRFLFVPILLVACTALFYVSGALAVHDVGVFQLDGNAITSVQSSPTAAEDWDLICKADRVKAGTLAANITATATSITVNETNGIDSLLPVNIQIDNEQMTVTARTGSANPFTYTVTRHIDGTTAAAHTSGTDVFTGCLFQHNYKATSAATAGAPPAGNTVADPSTFIVDQSNTSVDDILKSGTKDDNDIPSWNWASSGSLDKNDLTDGSIAEYVCSDASATCGTGHENDKLLYFMADRYGISGSANVAFWLFQHRVQQYADGTGAKAGQCVTQSGCPFTTDGKAPNGIPAGQTGSNLATHVQGNCTLTGFAAGCVHGDILVIGAFGPHASLNVFEYVGPGNATKNYNGTNQCFTAICSLQPVLVDANGDCATIGNGDNGCAVANTGAPTTSPWILPQKNIQGKPVGDQFNADDAHGLSTFFEGGLNLTGLGFGDVCFSSFLVNSRSSAAGDSELHDKLLGSFQRCAPELTTQQSVAAVNGAPGTVQPGTAVTDTATIQVNGATSPDDAQGTVNFSLCGPVATIPAQGNVCDVTGVTIVGAGSNKTLNNTNCDPDSPSNTDGKSCAVSDSVNGSSGTNANLANGYYCFKATASLTNYDSPEGSFTNNTTECFQVLKIPTGTVTTPQQNGSNISGNVTFSTTASITDHAVVTATASGGGPVTGSVAFFICDPDDLAAANGGAGEASCLGTTGNQVGSAVTLTAVSPATTPPSAYADSTPAIAPNKLGKWCWRAVYTPTGSVYSGSSDSSTGECFNVVDTSSVSSLQAWIPNDSGSVSSTNGAPLHGTLSITLYPTSDCTGTAVTNQSYSQTVNGGTTASVSSSNDANGYVVSGNGSHSVSWKVHFASTDSNVTVTNQDHCESTTMTITN